MIRVTVDEVLKARLRGFKEPVEVCDTDGEVLGRFIPLGRLSSTDGPKLTWEERQQRKMSSRRTYSTPEVLAYLVNLE